MNIKEWNKVVMSHQLNIALIVGSAPDAVRIKSWDLSVFSSCIVINNAWQLSEDWDYLIYPEDFPVDRLPPDVDLTSKKLITAREFVPEQNSFGGFVYGGGTMAFTAGYWALGSLRPDVIAYLGCDMVYPAQTGNSSHFYGNGQADPLRPDITLQSLEAKSVRFMAFAQTNHCTIVNLSELSESRLLFPRASIEQFASEQIRPDFLSKHTAELDLNLVKKARQVEEQLAYMVPSGRYWEALKEFDESKLSEIDSLWLESFLNKN